MNKDYENSHAFAAKFLKEDGTIVDKLPVEAELNVGSVSIDMTSTNDILNKQLKVITDERTGSIVDITNPNNLNLNTIITSAKKITIAVISGSVTHTANGKTGTIPTGVCLEFGNGLNPYDTNIVLNGTCDLIVGWEW